jgi:hypothetical protein
LVGCFHCLHISQPMLYSVRSQTSFYTVVATLVHKTQLTGTIPEAFCNWYKENRAKVVLDCNETLVQDCSCCDNLTICFDRIPESVQNLLWSFLVGTYMCEYISEWQYCGRRFGKKASVDINSYVLVDFRRRSSLE